ncbi:MAG: phosphoenolpyruvate synthase [Gammaproteobacteria bacterium]|nr:phosphoenolpyruvate synthase [Gammaproteobacteria bacterium]
MLVQRNSTDYFARNESGGKGYNLYLMQQAGIPVPDWVIVGKSVYGAFISKSGLLPKINQLIQAFQANTLGAGQLSDGVKRLIIDTTLPPDIVSLVNEAYQKVARGGMIAVRSSAADEDGSTYSFAGQLSSYLYVNTVVDAARYLKLCWASAFSARAIAYRVENTLSLQDVSVAVIFQTMIDPDASGVMFTCDPADATADNYVISAVYGVGEGLVSGLLECDTFWVEAQSGRLLRREIVEKQRMLRQGGSGHCEPQAVDPAKTRLPTLDHAQLNELIALGATLREIYKMPQDIEWAIAAGQLFILQTRPVTTIKYNTQGFPNLWDNANIVESYAGITLPLTFSFALENYKNVYIQFCGILGVSAAVVKDMEHYLGNMLGCINGRVFYNLYNWYKLVGVLPGFKHNRQFMETMMGVGQSLSAEIKERIEPHPSWNTLLGRLRKLRTGLTFIYYHFTINAIVEKFLRDFDRDYQIYRRKPFSKMRGDELFRLYIEINRKFLNKWKAPIINDFLCMVHFGILNKLTVKWLSQVNCNLQNDLLAGGGDLESAEPTKMLIRYANEISDNQALHALVMSTPDYVLFEALKQSDFQEFYAKVCHYIDRFGYRCNSEMKLEVKDLYVDPSFMFTCIKNYIRAGISVTSASAGREKALRAAAETTLNAALHGWKKILYRWSLNHARQALKNRENTRFSRTRIYGVVRALFRELGARLRQDGVITAPEDIYYLTLQELYGIYQGTLTSYNLKALAALRKHDYCDYQSLEPKIRFQTRGPVYWKNDFLEKPDPTPISPGTECDLSGIACCPGIVEAKVRVIHSLTDDLVLNGEILVAMRTDPGWVPIFPSISGLLVERGSLLSHSAIVAREMGIPAVVGIKGLLTTLTDGMVVRMDGKNGTVKILKRA